jgi:hypothetical protein
MAWPIATGHRLCGQKRILGHCEEGDADAEDSGREVRGEKGSRSIGDGEARRMLILAEFCGGRDWP